MADEVDDYQRFLSGAMSPREEAAFRQRFESTGGQRDLLDGLRDALRAQENARPDDVDTSWQDMLWRLSQGDRPALASRFVKRAAHDSTTSRRRARRVLGFVAAAAAVFLVCFIPARNHKMFADHTATPHVFTADASKGDGLHVVLLPDSTRVTLAPDSRVSYLADYGRGNRDVTLTGRAEFQVRHDKSRPFRVHVRDALLEDLGTRFTVAAYSDIPVLRVAVAEGSIDVRRTGTPSATILTPGLAAQLDTQRDTIIVRIADRDADFGWTSGTSSFHGTPLRDIVAQLSHNYERSISVADSALATRRLEVSFTFQETGEQACQTLAILTHSRCGQKGSALELSPMR
jgi:ferric-dicitrate binding protein FerR (iron transport regulator)